MAGERKTAASAGHRPSHYIGQWAILMYEIEIRRCKVRQPVSQVAHYGNGLEKYFGQYYCRPQVQIDSAIIQIPDDRTQQQKVLIGSLPDCRATGARVNVDDVRADRDVHRRSEERR